MRLLLRPHFYRIISLMPSTSAPRFLDYRQECTISMTFPSAQRATWVPNAYIIDD